MPTTINGSIHTYDQVGRKEDISDIITNISPTTVPFQSGIGSEGIHNILHQWQEDSLIAANPANAQVEGAAAPAAVAYATVMRNNTTQILSKTASVTNTADRVKTYGRDKEMAYQLAERSKELKRDLEATFVGQNQAAVTGNDTTARQMASYFAMLDGSAVYVVNGSSGTLNTGNGSTISGTPTAGAITESGFLVIAQQLFQNGADPDTWMVTPLDGLTVAGFQANGRTRFVDNGEKSITNVVDVYTSPYGRVSVKMNRFLLSSTSLVYEAAMWKKLVLRNWFRQTLAVTGDATNVQIIGEFSLKHRNFAASGAFLNLNG